MGIDFKNNFLVIAHKLKILFERRNAVKIYAQVKKEVVGRNYYFLNLLIRILFFIIALMLGGGLGWVLLPLLNIDLKEVSTLFGVVGGALVSLLIAEANRENEINKHREKWCSELRVLYSEFFSSVNSLRRRTLLGTESKVVNSVGELRLLSFNLNKSDEEMKKVESGYNILTLYLFSKNKDDPKQIVFSSIDDYYEGLRKSIDRIFYVASIHENTSAFLWHEKGDQQVKSAIIDVKEYLSENLRAVTFKVKVLIDYEWEILYGKRNEGSYRKLLFNGLLIMLVSAFVFFIIKRSYWGGWV